MARVSLSWALILGLLAGIGPMCTDLYLPALPEMSEQLAATTTITQLTLTASLIGLGVGQLLFGPLSDKIGRKRPLILSLLLFLPFYARQRTIFTGWWSGVLFKGSRGRVVRCSLVLLLVTNIRE
ncbi:hypothetical protein A1U7_02208 [Escherichia coli KTE67]|nr:hypothetical protein A1U7_02208 [Escherichia coli KTE67]